MVDQPKGLSGVSRVGIDDRAAMRELADYVLGLGHREIGLLTMRLGPDRRQDLVDADQLKSLKFDVQRERIFGVWEAMTAAGIDPDSLTVVESYEHLPTSGGTAAKVALEANPRITALMCTADILALSAMDYLRAHGIYVPGQMSVSGFDGIPEAISRGLTTVAQPSLQKGRRAGELLLKPPRSGLPVVELLETELIRGRTAGPPALDLINFRVSPINNRTARSSRLLTSVADARRVSQASRFDNHTSEITRAMWYWSSVGSPSLIARANMPSMSFST